MAGGEVGGNWRLAARLAFRVDGKEKDDNSKDASNNKQKAGGRKK